jgi:hypothetical protein
MESDGINIPKCARADPAEKIINVLIVIKAKNLFIFYSSFQDSLAGLKRHRSIFDHPFSIKKATKIICPDSYQSKGPPWPFFAYRYSFVRN